MASPKLRAWDLETTSKIATEARIWSFGTDIAETLINPGVPIPAEVQELCHIGPDTLERIAAAPAWSDVGPDLVADLRQYDALVTQNGPRYDVPVLESPLHVNGPAELPRVIDVRVLAFEAWPNLLNHKLGTIAKSLYLVDDATLEQQAHNSLFDCQLSLQVYAKLPPKWIADLDACLAFQGRAAAIQTRDWELYGVTPEDGPRFLWFRTCRRCMGQKCKECNGLGVLCHTKKKRGQRVDPGYLRWVKRRAGIPQAVREL